MLWFDFFFGLFFLNQFKFFKLGWKFSNQIEIFIFFDNLSIKKGKYLFTFLYPILSYSHWVPLDLFYPPATLPFPPNPH